MVAEAFVQGMRRQGYRDTARALDELVDNAIQAGAQRVDVVFNLGNADKTNQPSQIAIVDTGHGMDGEMIRIAMMWGGSHRADKNDRSGFGRFGFGLPTASLSQGRSYTVYSRPIDGDMHAARFDTDQLNVQQGQVQIQEATTAQLPSWIADYITAHIGTFSNGTVVVLDDLDNLSPKTEKALEEHLLLHFGLFYRRFVGDTVSIRVNGKRVDRIDPLYLDPLGKDYSSSDELIAEEVISKSIEVKLANGGSDFITFRCSYMPIGFAEATNRIKGGPTPSEAQADSKDEEEIRRAKGRRYRVRRETTGLIFMRHKRQIDVVRPNVDGWFQVIPRDTFWACEIDFPATLDEEFGVTTNKQHIVPSPRIWDSLNTAGLQRIITEMRQRRLRETATLQEDKDAHEVVVDVMETGRDEDKRLRRQRPFLADDPKRISRANAQLEREARELASRTGAEVGTLLEKLKRETPPYAVRYEDRSENGPFYDVDSWGGQKQLIINSNHLFYRESYSRLAREAKAALLLLLFVLAESEIDAPDATRQFYLSERSQWSEQLRTRIRELSERAFRHAEDEEGPAVA
jgi:hypothetical protein